MKPMKDRKMDMNRGEVDSEAFFPESAHHKKMPRAGEIRGFKYPDTEEEIHRDQEQFVRSTDRAAPKPEFRH
jgi:hypothetical protein